MNIRKTITSEIEWNTIKKAQADGKLQELLQVGDELDITLKTGEELTVQAVGTTERGLIFLLKDCMKDEHGMNKRMTSKGGWRDSEMRLWLNETIIRMLPDENARRIVRETEGVTGFVGTANKPIPLTEEEVLAMGMEKHEIVVGYNVGDHVRIVDGPLASFTGVVEDIEPEKNQVSVMVSMFGRETPVELELDQVEVLN